MLWYVYMVECSDGSYYTGITRGWSPSCVQQRVSKHNAGRGAKYTRSRRPVHLLWYEVVGLQKGYALRREFEIKSLSRPEKQMLVKGAAA